MDFSLLLFGAIMIGYIGTLIFSANQHDLEQQPAAVNVPYGSSQIASSNRSTIIRWMLYGIAAMNFVYAMLIIYMAVLRTTLGSLEGDAAAMLQDFNLDSLPQINQTAALVNLILAVMISIFAVRVVQAASTRQFIHRLVGGHGIYRPDSTVHTVAVVLALVYFSITIGQLVVSGGLEGLAQDIEASGVSLGGLFFQTAMFIVIAFLGIGMAIRRTLPQSLERLGLRIPTLQDVTWGVGVGFALYGALIVMGIIWASFVPIEQIEEQNAAAQELAGVFNTLPLAFLLSITAAVSEEILFRGALQPVFGLVLTSLFFALVHIQYSLTPATLIIFLVALVLGWLRQRQSTTSAIIAHFVYNFVQLALAILTAGALGGV